MHKSTTILFFLMKIIRLNHHFFLRFVSCNSLIEMWCFFICWWKIVGYKSFSSHFWNVGYSFSLLVKIFPNVFTKINNHLNWIEIDMVKIYISLTGLVNTFLGKNLKKNFFFKKVTSFTFFRKKYSWVFIRFGLRCLLIGRLEIILQ